MNRDVFSVLEHGSGTQTGLQEIHSEYQTPSSVIERYDREPMKEALEEVLWIPTFQGSLLDSLPFLFLLWLHCKVDSSGWFPQLRTCISVLLL